MLVFESFSRPSRRSVIEPPTSVMPCVRAGSVQLVAISDRVPLLGKDDDVGSGRGRFRDQRFGLFQIRRLVRPARELDAGDAQRAGHRLAG